MANVHRFGDSPMDFYWALPPVTRAWATACVATTLAIKLGLVHPAYLYLHWPSVLKGFQVWRLVTNFVFIGGFSFHFLITLIWLITYGKQLERGTFQFSTADFVYMLMVCGGAMLALTAAVPPLNLGFLGTSLVFTLLYVWSRYYPTVNASIMGLFNVQAFYLPFAFLAVSVMMGGNWLSDLLGILAGHLYYFLKVLHPAAGGASYLDTPAWLSRAVHRMGIGSVPPADLRGGQPGGQQGAYQPAGFRAFRGAGRRLAD